MKYILPTILLFLGISIVGNAQMRVQKIGDNPTNLNSSAALEIESTTKGLLMPRVALQSLSLPSPLSAMVKGMIVYNTTTNADLSEGFYMNNGSEWVLLVTKNNLSASRSGDLNMKGDNIFNASTVKTGELQIYDNNLHEFYGGNDINALSVIKRENNFTKIYDARTLKPLFSISNSATGANASNDSGAGGRVGINTDAPDLSADLTLASTNRGLLLNRVALTGSGDNTTVPQTANYLVVFNTATVADITPGIYYWSSSQNKWIRSGENVPNASSSTLGKIQLVGDLGGTATAPTVPGLALKEPTITAGTTTQYFRGDKTWQTLDKSAVGLSNVDNTSDVNKPISTAAQSALDQKAPLASPALSGTPTAPTAAAGTSSAQIATTSYVSNAISAAATADASTTATGKVQLAGDLGGVGTTAAAPIISNDAITSIKIKDGEVLTSDIAASAITTSKLADAAITNAKIGETILVSKGGTGANMSSTSGYVKQASVGANFSTTSTIPVADVNGAVQKVNGISPDANGNVAISIGSVTTGVLSARPATSANNGDFYVVSNDGANNGLTYIWDGSQWHEVTPNQAATDARYVQQDGDTMNGDLIMSNGKKITLNYVPSNATDAVNKSYIDGVLPTAATNSTLGTIQMTGDLSGPGTAPVIANNAVTNAKIGETILVSKGGTGATTLTGYVKGNGTAAMTASASIPVADVTGAQTTANLSNSLTTDSGSATMYPSVAAVESYVASNVAAATPDATSLIKGKIQLTGDLGGTAASPTVPGLALKEPTIAAGTTTQYYRGDKSWQTLDKTVVGLGNVDNTSDVNKPISTATQSALDLKAPLASPALTGTPTAPTATAGTSTTQVATTAFVTAAIGTPVSSVVSGIVNNVGGQELGGVDKKINGIDVGRGAGNISSNTRLGSNALVSNTTGIQNVAFGEQSQYSNTTGSFNTAIGQASLVNNTTGAQNTAIGKGALLGVTTGSYNVGIGYQALASGVVGLSNNVAIGTAALSQTGGSSIIAIGSNAGYWSKGSNGTFIGFESGLGSTTGSSTGANNTFIGYQSGRNFTSGGNNVVISNNQDDLTTGSNNVILGLSNITTGSYNVILGGSAGNKINLASPSNSGVVAIGDGYGSVRIFSDANGNTGIGNSLPTEKLDIAGSIKQTGVISSLLKADSNGKIVGASVSDISGVQTTANLSSNITTNTGSTTMYPSVSAVENYVSNNATPSASNLLEGKIQLTKDLAGTSSLPKVVGLQGVAISSIVPSTNQILKYNGTNWVPTSIQLETEEFTATAGQTSFTITNIPLGKVSVFRNGVRLPKTSIGVSGLIISYTASNNNNQAMVVGDRITIDYVY